MDKIIGLIPYITDIKCLDGKKHHWIHTDTSDSYGNRSRESWCNKCGSKTEWVDVNRNHNYSRCQEDEDGTRSGKYYIVIPRLLPGSPPRKRKKKCPIPEDEPC